MIINEFKRIVIAIICGMTTFYSSAQQRTQSQAADIAIKALSKEMATSREALHKAVSHSCRLTPVNSSIIERSISLKEAGMSKQEMPSFAIADKQPFYIFNDESSHAFVIVAGDERMGDVLGYSMSSSFTTNQMPDGMAGLLCFYAQTYADICRKTTMVHAPQKAIAWKAIPQMIHSTWGQGKPYNADCPIHNGQRSLVGCAATAMAQVMRYHQWPSQGKGSYSYTTGTAHLEQSLEFGSITFNWNNMSDNYNSNQNAPDVAKLSHACGVSIAMNYTYNNSWAYCLDIPYALVQYFSYSSDVVCYRKEFFSVDKWASIIQRELLEGRPIILRGANAKDDNGHFFIIDGCDEDGNLHVNWGWYGNSDGFFKIDGIGLDAMSDDYSYGQWAILKISPTDLEEPEDVFFADSFSAHHIGNYTSTQITSVYNHANTACLKDENTRFNGYIGVALYDASGKFLKMAGSSSQVSLRSNWGYSSLYINFDDKSLNLSDGQYTLRPVVVNSERNDNLVTPIRTLGGETDSLFLVIADGQVNVMAELPTDIASTYATLTRTQTRTYSLDGRRIKTSKNRRGFYIVDGKKRLSH